jgi:hypothetical protein
MPVNGRFSAIMKIGLSGGFVDDRVFNRTNGCSHSNSPPSIVVGVFTRKTLLLARCVIKAAGPV